MGISKDRLGALLLLIFSSAYWYFAYDIRLLPFQMNAAFHARTMPVVLGVLGVGLSLALLIFPGSKAPPEVRGFNWGIGIVMLVLMVLYGLLVRPLGFIIATSLFLMGGYWALGERKPWLLLVASVPLVVLFWILMTQGLDVFIEPWPTMFKSSGP